MPCPSFVCSKLIFCVFQIFAPLLKMSGSSKRGGGAGYGGASSSQAKKPKNDDDEDTPNFEDHLAGLDEEDFMDCDFPVAEGEGPAQQTTYRKWARPSPPSLDPKVDSLTFQQVELDHYIGQARPDMAKQYKFIVKQSGYQATLNSSKEMR